MAKDVSEDELSQAKELINTSLNMNKDDLFRIVDNYYFQDISDLDEETIQSYINKIKEYKSFYRKNYNEIIKCMD